MTSFAAIDFETADYKQDRACSVGIVVVRSGRISTRYHSLIRPPRKRFVPMFVDLHGISWEMVQEKKTFAEVWPEFAPILNSVDFVAAHNAPFDISVLNACCLAAGITPPGLEVCCTLKIGRQLWKQPKNALPDLCQHLGIPFSRHHDALADAEACAQIVKRAFKAGWTFYPAGNIITSV